MKQPLYPINIYVLIIIFLSGLNCSNDQTQRASKSKQGISLSDIQLANIDGTPFDLKTLTGKPVFLNIWATWCKPCIAEMPSIERTYQELKDSDIVFLLASDESLSQISDFQNKHSYSFQYVQLKSGLESVQSYALPTTILFDHTGSQVSIERGAKVWDDPQEIQKLKELIKKQ